MRRRSFIDSSPCSFPDLETIVAVRLSLLRFALQKEQREQIGDMLSPLAQALKDTQTACLLRLSEAARQADQTQIAMNSVVRAQQISMEPTTDVSEEFSQVLWLMKEPKLAVQYLRQSLGHGHKSGSEKPPDSLRSASTLARLVRYLSSHNHLANGNGRVDGHLRRASRSRQVSKLDFLILR